MSQPCDVNIAGKTTNLLEKSWREIKKNQFLFMVDRSPLKVTQLVKLMVAVLNEKQSSIVYII